MTIKKHLNTIIKPLFSLKFSLDKFIHNLMLSYSLQNSKIGKNVQIMNDNSFINPENISIGDHVFIGQFGEFFAQGGIEIKKGTIIGPKCTIYTTNHNFNSSDLQSIPYDNRDQLEKVIINKFVWVGGNVLILPGVNIGKFAVIGAGSVVTKDVPPYAVVGGNPAKMIKQRINKKKCDELEKEKKAYLKLKTNLEI